MILHNGGSRASPASSGSASPWRAYYFLHCHMRERKREREREQENKRERGEEREVKRKRGRESESKSANASKRDRKRIYFLINFLLGTTWMNGVGRIGGGEREEFFIDNRYHQQRATCVNLIAFKPLNPKP